MDLPQSSECRDDSDPHILIFLDSLRNLAGSVSRHDRDVLWNNHECQLVVWALCALYRLWQDQRVCIKIEAMHCDICHVTSDSIYLQKKKTLNWRIKGQNGPSTTPEGDLRRWAGNVPGWICIDVALRSCRASCDVSAQENWRWDSVRARLMYEAVLIEYCMCFTSIFMPQALLWSHALKYTLVAVRRLTAEWNNTYGQKECNSNTHCKWGCSVATMEGIQLQSPFKKIDCVLLKPAWL